MSAQVPRHRNVEGQPAEKVPLRGHRRFSNPLSEVVLGATDGTVWCRGLEVSRRVRCTTVARRGGGVNVSLSERVSDVDRLVAGACEHECASTSVQMW